MKHELIMNFIDNADHAYREFDDAIKIDQNDPDIYYHRFFSNLNFKIMLYILCVYL